VQLATAIPFPLLVAFGTVTRGERGGAKTRVRGINLAAGTGAWAIGFQAWEGTRENPAATTKPRWAASSFGFTGREHELDSGLVYARDRYLASATGRWTQADRLGFTAGPNLFAYVSSGPTRFADPLGRAGEDPSLLKDLALYMSLAGANEPMAANQAMVVGGIAALWSMLTGPLGALLAMGAAGIALVTGGVVLAGVAGILIGTILQQIWGDKFYEWISVALDFYSGRDPCGIKDDLKQIRQIARAGGIVDEEELREFMQFIHEEKAHGRGGTKNARGDFTSEEIRTKIQEFRELYYP
jgi:RHS repeat-associated protein